MGDCGCGSLRDITGRGRSGEVEDGKRGIRGGGSQRVRKGQRGIGRGSAGVRVDNSRVCGREVTSPRGWATRARGDPEL
jgi:hypothetical protein